MEETNNAPVSEYNVSELILTARGKDVGNINGNNNTSNNNLTRTYNKTYAGIFRFQRLATAAD